MKLLDRASCFLTRSHVLAVGAGGSALPAHQVPDHPHGHQARERAALHRRARRAQARDRLAREAEEGRGASRLLRCAALLALSPLTL